MNLQSILRRFVASTCLLRPVDMSPRILCYHHVAPTAADKWTVTQEQLRGQLQWIRNHCHPVSLDEVVDWMDEKCTLPSRSVAITFDDGFSDLIKYALPLFEEYQMRATLFVPSSIITHGKDVAAPLFRPKLPFMNWNEVRILREKGWLIGSHSLTHPILSTLSRDMLEKELVESRKEIENMLGEKVDYLAYPYGISSAVSKEVMHVARDAGYRAAFMNTIGKISATTNRMRVNRCKVLGTDSPFIFKATLSGRMDPWGRIENLNQIG